ncbi:MAG: transglutaminase domain-containing protein, partial [Bacteroidales bacterium]|nr:transglutaminase domain-containing protein [Bacteroidales bacterium]
TAEGNLKIAKPSSRKKQTLRIIAKYPEDESNNIFPGENYELFYWDNQWISLGEQKAVETFLEYPNAPVNALFWIRNLDKGFQERIFIYENGKQIWY